MSRYLFGGTAADVTTLTSGRVAPGAEGTAWTDRVGGAQVLDLATLTGDTTTVVTSGERGEVLFYGPDGFRSDMWLDFGLGYRFLIRPVNISGLSAYEVALAEGFEGDAQAWLDSLASTVPGPTGKVGYDWKGEWVATDYVTHDLVTHDGSLWLCIADNNGLEPGAAPVTVEVGSVVPDGGSSGGSSGAIYQAFVAASDRWVSHMSVPAGTSTARTMDIRDATGAVLATYTTAGNGVLVPLSAPVQLVAGATYHVGVSTSATYSTMALSGVVGSLPQPARQTTWNGTAANFGYFARFTLHGDSVESWKVLAEGINGGGTTGQALVKASDTDYDTAWQTVVPASAFTVNTLLFGNSSAALTALSVPASSIVGRGASGEIAALDATAARTVLGLATTDSPTFAGATVGPSNGAGATLGPELGTAASLTQSLTGLTVGASYYVSTVSGTTTAITLDGTTVISQAASTSRGAFTATATAHTVVGSGGTATAISVKQVTAATPATVLSGMAVHEIGDATATGPGASSNINTSVSPTGRPTMLRAVSTSQRNLAIGGRALEGLVEGFSNTAYGASTLFTLVCGQGNSAVGTAALALLQFGQYNVAQGGIALSSLVTGLGNTAIGYFAGNARTSGNYNTDVGYRAGFTATSAALSGTVTIGTDSTGTPAAVTANDTIALGTPLHSMKCGAVSGETGLWAFGVKKDATVALDTTGYLSIKVDGTVYKIALVN